MVQAVYCCYQRDCGHDGPGCVLLWYQRDSGHDGPGCVLLLWYQRDCGHDGPGILTEDLQWSAAGVWWSKESVQPWASANRPREGLASDACLIDLHESVCYIAHCSHLPSANYYLVTYVHLIRCTRNWNMTLQYWCQADSVEGSTRSPSVHQQRVIFSGWHNCLSLVYTIQPVVKQVVKPVTGCIVYTNIQLVVKPVWQPSVLYIQPVVQPSLTTDWTNSGCSFDTVVKPVLATGCIVYTDIQPVVQRVWQSVVACKWCISVLLSALTLLAW